MSSFFNFLWRSQRVDDDASVGGMEQPSSSATQNTSGWSNYFPSISIPSLPNIPIPTLNLFAPKDISDANEKQIFNVLTTSLSPLQSTLVSIQNELSTNNPRIKFISDKIATLEMEELKLLDLSPGDIGKILNFNKDSSPGNIAPILPIINDGIKKSSTTILEILKKFSEYFNTAHSTAGLEARQTIKTKINAGQFLFNYEERKLIMLGLADLAAKYPNSILFTRLYNQLRLDPTRQKAVVRAQEISTILINKDFEEAKKELLEIYNNNGGKSFLPKDIFNHYQALQSVTEIFDRQPFKQQQLDVIFTVDLLTEKFAKESKSSSEKLALSNTYKELSQFLADPKKTDEITPPQPSLKEEIGPPTINSTVASVNNTASLTLFPPSSSPKIATFVGALNLAQKSIGSVNSALSNLSNNNAGLLSDSLPDLPHQGFAETALIKMQQLQHAINSLKEFTQKADQIYQRFNSNTSAIPQIAPSPHANKKPHQDSSNTKKIEEITSSNPSLKEEIDPPTNNSTVASVSSTASLPLALPFSFPKIASLVNSLESAQNGIARLNNALSPSSNTNAGLLPGSMPDSQSQSFADTVLGKMLQLHNAINSLKEWTQKADQIYQKFNSNTSAITQIAPSQTVAPTVSVTTNNPVNNPAPPITTPTIGWDAANHALNKVNEIASTLQSLFQGQAQPNQQSNQNLPNAPQVQSPNILHEVKSILSAVKEAADKIKPMFDFAKEVNDAPVQHPSTVERIQSTVETFNQSVQTLSAAFNRISTLIPGLAPANPNQPVPQNAQNPLDSIKTRLFALIEGQNPQHADCAALIGEIDQILNAPPVLHIQKNQWDADEIRDWNGIKTDLQGIVNTNPFTVAQPVKDALSQKIKGPLSKHFSKWDYILNMVQSFAATATTKVGEAVAKTACTQLASSLHSMLSLAGDRIRNPNGQGGSVPNIPAAILPMLDQFLGNLNNVKTNGSWRDLASAMNSFKNAAVQQFPLVSVNNSIFSMSALDSFLSLDWLFKPQGNAVKPPDMPFATILPKPEIKPNTPVNFEAIEASTNLHKNEMVRNFTNYTVMHFIYERLLGIKLDNPLLLNQVIDAAHTASANPASGLTFETAAKQRFFHELDLARKQGKINIFSYWAGKLMFIILNSQLQGVVNKFSENILQHVRQVLVKKDMAGFEELQNSTAKRLSSYLGALGNAFRNILKRPPMNGRIDEEVAAEMSKKEYNHGHTVSGLYQGVAKKALGTFMADLTLSAFFKHLFEKGKANSNTFPKRAYNFALSVASGLTSILVFVPSIALKFFLVDRFQKWLVTNNKIEQLIDISSNAIEDKRGYTHAINVVIANQLQDVLSELNNPNSTPLSSTPQSEGKRKNLEELVKNLLDVVKMTKCSTTRELEELIEKKSVKNQIESSIEDIAVPQVVKSVVELINTAYTTIMNREHMEKQLANFMTMLNSSLRDTTQVEPATVKATEVKIELLLDQILEITLERALKEKLEFSMTDQVKHINDFSSGVRNQIQGLKDVVEAQKNASRDAYHRGDRNAAANHIRTLLTQFNRVAENLHQNFFTDISAKQDLSGYIKDHLKTASHNGAVALNKIKQPLEAMQSLLDRVLRGEQINDLDSQVNALHDQLNRAQGDLYQWLQSEDLKAINPHSINFAQWKWLTDFIKGNAKAIVKERSKYMLDFLRKPYNLRYGLFHHLAFIPFIGEKV